MSEVFLSYRRGDASGYAGRLYDRLRDHFGADHVFRDLDTLAPGADFVVAMEEAIGSCDALVALIGRDWLTVKTESGGRRIDQPDDFVRVEIGAALARGIPVFPVLVEGSRMPSEADLPAPLTALSRRNAVDLSDSRWDYDVSRLIAGIEGSTSRRKAAAKVSLPASADQSASELLQSLGYEYVSTLGRGTFTIVHRARQASLNRLVAVKLLFGATPDAEAQRRFTEETAALGPLSGHPNIVTVYESGLTLAGFPYVVMQYLNKGSLAHRLAREGSVAWQESLSLGIKLAGALEVAHRDGLLHQDVHPGNILVSDFGEPQLSEFCFARLVHRVEMATRDLPQSIRYWAPEVLRGEPSTRCSDVYSLACSLFTVLAGQPPFFDQRDQSIVSVLARIVGEPVSDLRHKGIPDEVCAVIERAMDKDADRRYQTALELGQDLQRVQRTMGLAETVLPLGDQPQPTVVSPGAEDEPVTPDPAPAPTAPDRVLTPTPHERRRSRRLAGVTGVALVALLAVAWSIVGNGASRAGDRAGPVEATTTQVAPTTTTPPTITTPPVVGEAWPGSASADPIAPAVYRSQFLPAFTMRLGEGWRQSAHPGDGHLFLQKTGAENQLFSVLRVDRAYDPAGGSDAAARDLAPDDLMGWLHSHPRLVAEEPVPVTVSGRSALRVDVTVREGSSYQVDNCGRCVLMFRGPQFQFRLAETNRNRLYLIKFERYTVVIAAEARTHDFDAFSPVVEDMVSSLTFV